MIAFVSRTRRPDLVPWLGGVAASGKLLGATLLGLPLASPAVINPVAAILLEALAFRLVTVFFWREESLRVRSPGWPCDTD